MARQGILLAALLSRLLSASVAAVEVRSVEVRAERGRYIVHGESLVAAPRAFVFSVLADYDHFDRLAGGITETRWLPAADDGPPLAYTRIETCVWFFCRRLEKVERVRLLPPDRVVTEVLPERSDFRYSVAAWTLLEAGEQTRVIYDAVFEPDFWVPPLIGPWAIKRKLRLSAEQMGGVIEQLQHTAPPATGP